MFSNVFVCFFWFVCLSLSSFCQFSFSSNSPFYSLESIKERQTEMASFLILPPFDRLASANSSNYIYVTLLTWQPDIHFSSVKWKGRFCLISFSFFFSSLLRSFFCFCFWLHVAWLGNQGVCFFFMFAHSGLGCVSGCFHC